jgi:hypothetical protein
MLTAPIGPMPLPPNVFLQGPPVIMPLRAIGAMVMDANGQTIANCPNGALADLVAWTMNDRYCPQVHR